MLFAQSALVAVGALEASWGAFVLAFPTLALTCSIGRILTVGATASSPALMPMLAQVGALRLALGVLVVAAATSRSAAAEDSHEIEACVIAHACLLQPFVHTFRRDQRLPTSGNFAVSLLEGGVLVAAIAADAGFNLARCMQTPGFVACASLLAAGVVLTLVAAILDSCRRGTSVDNATGGVERTMSGGGAAPLLFDETRHQLSPTAKRLLA